MKVKWVETDWMETWAAMRSRLRDLEVVTILAALGIVVTILGFAALADDVMEGDTLSFDRTILEGLRSAGDTSQLIGPSWLEGVAANFTALGGVTVSTFLVLAVVGFLAIRRAWLELALVAGATIGGTIVTFALKAAFNRPRPDIVPHLVAVSDPSFPSGHAMLSAVIYLTLGTLTAEFLAKRSLKAYVMAVAFTVTFFVGLTRVLLGVHYPTDVLAGWSIGLGWALSCWLVVRYFEFRLGPDQFELEGAREDAAQMGEHAEEDG